MLDKSYQKVVMEVKIKTFTPILTGGIEAGKCDRIHETGWKRQFRLEVVQLVVRSRPRNSLRIT